MNRTENQEVATKQMTPSTNNTVGEIKSRLIGLECWYVSTGVGVGGTFSLALGNHIRRSRPLSNSTHSEEFRNYEGEANVYVWCTWRLDGPEEPLSSSDDTDDGIRQGLSQLVGCTITNVAVASPAWDLQLMFSSGAKLHVFCDHVPGDPSFDGNWEMRAHDLILYFGPGSKSEIERPDSDRGD